MITNTHSKLFSEFQFCKIVVMVLFCSVVNVFVYNKAHLFRTHFQHNDTFSGSLGPPLYISYNLSA